MADLESAIGHVFDDPSLLTLALTHRSLEAEDATEESNERLEFLGDAVLGLVIAELLHESWDLPEGAMAKVRAAVVDEAALAGIARRLGLGEHLRLGKGEQASGGHDKASILADALEAVLGAVYLDAGHEEARRVITRHWFDLVSERAQSPGQRDYKTRLQEELARRSEVPVYSVTGTGPDHAREFTATVTVGDTVLGRGAGRSKKRAEQSAAREALASLAVDDA